MLARQFAIFEAVWPEPDMSVCHGPDGVFAAPAR